jgi:hypothetical protein
MRTEWPPQQIDAAVAAMLVPRLVAEVASVLLRDSRTSMLIETAVISATLLETRRGGVIA